MPWAIAAEKAKNKKNKPLLNLESNFTIHFQITRNLRYFYLTIYHWLAGFIIWYILRMLLISFEYGMPSSWNVIIIGFNKKFVLVQTTSRYHWKQFKHVMFRSSKDDHCIVQVSPGILSKVIAHTRPSGSVTEFSLTL